MTTSFRDVSRVCVIGPECTGKTALSESLAARLSTNWVEEHARNYLNNLDRPYEEHDLVKIAEGQLRLEDEKAATANKVLICDTNLIVIKIWSEVKYGRCDHRILDMISVRKYDLYLLTYIDIPWISDPLREHPEMREELYNMYLREMQNQLSPFQVVRGTGEQRIQCALEAIAQHIPLNR
jgi:NadR type nicotinamide-nucleotide adenylyltransferase